VQIVTKHLLPLYVAPSEKANAPTLSWTAQRIGNGLQIRAENKGGSRFPIRQLTVENNLGTKVPLTPAGRSVVLSGGSRQWLLTTGNQAALDGWSLVITDQSGQTTRHSLQPLLR
jgi:P pilus assembly chaperone PapD